MLLCIPDENAGQRGRPTVAGGCLRSGRRLEHDLRPLIVFPDEEPTARPHRRGGLCASGPPTRPRPPPGVTLPGGGAKPPCLAELRPPRRPRRPADTEPRPAHTPGPPARSC